MTTVTPEGPALTRQREFERLYLRYVDEVYRYALALMHNPADAEDVTQTTFMNAYRAYKRGEEPIKPHNWLIKIAHNAARSRYARLNRRGKEVPLDDQLDRLAVADGEKPDVKVVLEALAGLPFNQRAALVMRELEGRTYAEIADTLGASVAAVETLIFRARRSLKTRAAEIRVLGGVQLPSSLTHLWGGGAAAGGGGLLGTGLVLKATVAIVAGVLATGVGGDRTRRAQASPSPDRLAESVSLPTAAARPTTHRLRASVPVRRIETGIASARTRRPAQPDEDRAPTQQPEQSAAVEVPGQSSGQSPAHAVVTPPASKPMETVPTTLPTLPSPPTVSLPQLPSPPSVTVPVPPVPIPALP
jgi:RNA polymerase sigma factor (sigma-70 family)